MDILVQNYDNAPYEDDDERDEVQYEEDEDGIFPPGQPLIGHDKRQTHACNSDVKQHGSDVTSTMKHIMQNYIPFCHVYGDG